MNKRGQEAIAALFLIMFVALIIGGVLWLISLGLSKGSSTDIAYGVEENKFWYKLYLKDDHKTVYCIDKKDVDFVPVAKKAAENKQRVNVEYQEYLFRGSLCDSRDGYDVVVVTGIGVVGNGS